VRMFETSEVMGRPPLVLLDLARSASVNLIAIQPERSGSQERPGHQSRLVHPPQPHAPGKCSASPSTSFSPRPSPSELAVVQRGR
jgi:hypothetical protein